MNGESLFQVTDATMERHGLIGLLDPGHRGRQSQSRIEWEDLQARGTGVLAHQLDRLPQRLLAGLALWSRKSSWHEMQIEATFAGAGA